MSSSWFLGDCAVLQVDDRCKIFRLSLSSARTASLFRCVPYVRAFSLPRSACIYIYICVCRICVQREWERARASVRALTKLAKYAPLGGARTEAARPSLSNSPAYRVVVVSHFRPRHTAPHRTAPLRSHPRYHVGSRLREKRLADERITRKLVGDRPGRSSVHRA